MLTDKIYNEFSLLLGIDSVAQSPIGALCGVGRRNIQFPGIVGLLSEPKVYEQVIRALSQNFGCSYNVVNIIHLRSLRLLKIITFGQIL